MKIAIHDKADLKAYIYASLRNLSTVLGPMDAMTIYITIFNAVHCDLIKSMPNRLIYISIALVVIQNFQNV